MGQAVLVNQKDNVVTAVSDLKEGEEAAYGAGSDRRQIKTTEAIPFGHKIALSQIAKDSGIVKYGEIIGRAKTDIEPGEWVHTHNTLEIYTPSR